MVRGSRAVLLSVLAIGASGCATFQAKPLVGRDVLRDLQQIRLEALRPVDVAPAAPGASGAAFDPADGVSADEAVAVALFLNPDVRAFRKERGIAEGELIAARLLPNPELQLTWMHIENFTRGLATGGIGVSLNWAPPRPGERGAKTERAQARIENVRAQIVHEEWRLATDVRKAYVTLWAAQERLRLAEAAVTLQERLRRFLRDKRELGDASRLEVNLLELEYVERRREREVIVNDHQRARLEFNRILGLPPQAVVTLQGTDSLAYGSRCRTRCGVSKVSRTDKAAGKGGEAAMAASETLTLRVAELDCADEAQQIEGTLGRLDGVLDVRTAVSSRTAVVAYDPGRIKPEAITAAIAKLGMTPTGRDVTIEPTRRSVADRLGWAFVSLVAVVVLGGILVERLGVAENVAARIPPWVAIAAVIAGGYPIFAAVARALRNRSVTSHALMTLGIVGAVAIGQYGAAAVIVFFVRLADFVEGYTTERSRQAIKELLKLTPQNARVERDGREVEVAADDVRRGDVVLVKPGERIPVDGVVVEGRASVNQASITGESVPVEKEPGATVFAATICDRGALRVRADRVGPDTTFGQILRLVEQAEAAKAPVQRFADGFTAYYIPVVLAIAVATYFIGGSATAAVATVLVACSCAIAMATPITVLAAVGRSAKEGIVIKGGRYLEALAKVDTLVMDKTGTLTIGRPQVTDVVALDGASEKDVLALATALERRSEHPLAEGIVRAGETRGVAPADVKDFDVFPGGGVSATVNGAKVLCGTERLLAGAGIPIDAGVTERVQRLAGEGKSVVLVARAGRVTGIIALADTLREEAGRALEELRELGVKRLLLLTGDHERVAAAVAGKLGLEFEAEVLPEDKIRVIQRLQREGRVVAMVGDGVNDAPALARADVGIAMGAAGTDAAIEAAHVALMRDDWRGVPEAIRTGRRAFRTIKQNLWFTAVYNIVGMALAATGWLPPIAAAAAQSLPDVAVMLNSSRLLRRPPA